jgi:hypothetical protein
LTEWIHTWVAVREAEGGMGCNGRTCVYRYVTAQPSGEEQFVQSWQVRERWEGKAIMALVLFARLRLPPRDWWAGKL